MTCSTGTGTWAKWAGRVFVAGLMAGPVVSGQPARPDAHGFIAAQPEDLQPATGATQVVVFGDPAKPGMYVVRNTFAPGRGSRPHAHSQDRFVTVIKGTWWWHSAPTRAFTIPRRWFR